MEKKTDTSYGMIREDFRVNGNFKVVKEGRIQRGKFSIAECGIVQRRVRIRHGTYEKLEHLS